MVELGLTSLHNYYIKLCACDVAGRVASTVISRVYYMYIGKTGRRMTIDKSTQFKVYQYCDVRVCVSGEYEGLKGNFNWEKLPEVDSRVTMTQQSWLA